MRFFLKRPSLRTCLPLALLLGCSERPVATPIPEVVDASAEVAAELKPLLSTLRSGDPVERAYAATQLGNGCADRVTAITILEKMTHDPNALVRARAVEALGTLRAASASARLTELLRNRGEDRDVRARAAEVLGTLRVTEAREPLEEALKDMFWHIRFHAIVALGAIADPNSQPALEVAAQYDPHHANRDAARLALQQLPSS